MRTLRRDEYWKQYRAETPAVLLLFHLHLLPRYSHPYEIQRQSIQSWQVQIFAGVADTRVCRTDKIALPRAL